MEGLLVHWYLSWNIIFDGNGFNLFTYKQISEGYEDRERYQIMQKVGMSKKEVRDSIKSQVLLVFFLPLGASILHITVAFKVLKSCWQDLDLPIQRCFLDVLWQSHCFL